MPDACGVPETVSRLGLKHYTEVLNRIVQPALTVTLPDQV